MLAQQARGALDVERVVGGGGELGERGRELGRGTSRSRWLRSGRQSRAWSMRAPRPRPDEPLVEVLRRPLHEARRRRAPRTSSTRLVTPPVEVMTTTITTCGCSSRTSTWRIVAVSSGGAETIASRFVTCESVSVVTRIASSTSRRTRSSSTGLLRGRGQQAVDEVAEAGVGRDAAGRRVRVCEQAVLLEHRELVADRRRPGHEIRVGAQRLRAHGRLGLLVADDDLAQDELLAWRQHDIESRAATGADLLRRRARSPCRPARRGPRPSRPRRPPRRPSP